MKRLLLPLPLLVLFASACSDPRAYSRSIAVLVDVSGTYVDQKPEVVSLVKKGILPTMNCGDSMVVIRIDDRSYDKENVEATLHLDVRPSKANAQKLEFANRLDGFAAKSHRTSHTDIRGAIMLASDYLKETGAGRRTMIIFSDMVEDLPKGAKRDMTQTELAGTEVIAMNVKRLANDNANPAVYRDRLARWEKTVSASGAADWQVILDPERLVEYLQ